jgi:hypothetical protein
MNGIQDLINASWEYVRKTFLLHFSYLGYQDSIAFSDMLASLYFRILIA